MFFDLIFTAIVNLVVLIIWLVTRYQVYGLRGGYGKGVWAESSIYMMRARENVKTSTFLLCVVLIGDAIFLYGIYT